MRLFTYLTMASLMSIGWHGYAVEIVIKTEPDKPKEEEKKEPEEPELPARAQLNVNVINTTNFEFVVTSHVKAADQDYRYMIVQNFVAKNAPTTLGTLYAEAESTFEFISAEVFWMNPVSNHAITCEIKTLPEDDEKKDEGKEEKKDDGKEEKKDEGKEEKKDEKKPEEADAQKKKNPLDTRPSPAEQEEASANATAKKSIDFYLYTPAGHSFPSCAIFFDSVK